MDDFKEANCRFLTESLSWKGAIFEGNKQAFLRMSVLTIIIGKKIYQFLISF